MRRMILAAAGAGLMVALAGGGWWLFAASGNGPAAPKGGPGGPVTVEARSVEIGPMAREITAVGSLMAGESVMIRPEIAGRVLAIAFEEGQHVAKGHPLFRLDDSTLAADLDQARANLVLSKSNADRASRLAAQGAGTVRTQEEADNKLRIDQAKVEQARAALAKTQIVAPFAGLVGLRAVSVGAYVAPGQNLVNLEAVDPIKVEFRVPELLLAHVRTGQAVEVAADSYAGRLFSGSVYAIDPAIEAAGRSLVVRARIPNPEHLLRPGQFVRLSLKVEGAAESISIPEEAVVPKGDTFMVFKVVDDKAVPAPIKLGHRLGGMVEVTEGLAAGDVVVTAGQMKLRPGAAVKVAGSKTEG